MLKYSATALLAAAAIFMVLSQKPKVEEINTLTIGLQSGYPPFEYVDATGKVAGFDVDIAEKLSQKLGKKLVIKDMDFDAEILSLKQGKIDLIISGMNITPSRKKEILMVPYHGDKTASLSLLFWEAIPEHIRSIQDLEHLPVSVGAGTAAEMYLSQYPDINLKSFEGSLACLMDIKYGKSVANLVETDTAEYLQKTHPEVKIMSVPLEEELDGFGIGVNKNNQALFQQVTEAIQELKETGELQALEEKWFK